MGGVISDPKNFGAFFFALKTPILVMIFRKKRQKGGGGHFRSKKFHCKFGAVWSGLEKKSQHFFPKKGRGGGDRGRSEIFRKFIDIGKDGLPL